MKEHTMQFCKDVFGKDAETVYRIVKSAVDGYVAANRPTADEKRLIETAIYFVSDTELHKQSYEQAGSIDEKRETVIEKLEQVYGKAPERA